MSGVQERMELELNFTRVLQDSRRTAGIDSFRCESGAVLHHLDVAYETWGELNTKRDNVIVICHALTGDAHASDGAASGWWSAFVGPGKAIDTTRYFVICSNVLGGCSGTTGPASTDSDGKVYGLEFPLVTVRDMVRLQQILLNLLGIHRIRMVVGGSLGGMQAWEWVLLDPNRVDTACIIAAQAAFPALAIGYNAAMRQAITSDPAWCAGKYHETNQFPNAGLALARSIGMLTYRAGELYDERFSRRTVPSNEGVPHGNAFTEPVYEVESYLNYHGQKFVNRFDANSYLYLTRAMDSHDIGRGRGGLDAAFRNIAARLTLVGIESDYLYDARDLAQTALCASSAGVKCDYHLLSSPHGHDAFLIENDRLTEIIKNHLEKE